MNIYLLFRIFRTIELKLSIVKIIGLILRTYALDISLFNLTTYLGYICQKLFETKQNSHSTENLFSCSFSPGILPLSCWDSSWWMMMCESVRKQTLCLATAHFSSLPDRKCHISNIVCSKRGFSVFRTKLLLCKYTCL